MLINYRLVPSSNNQDKIINVEICLEDVLNEMMSEDSSNEAGKINLNQFNMKELRLKNLYHVWMLLIRIYLEKKSSNY